MILEINKTAPQAYLGNSPSRFGFKVNGIAQPEAPKRRDGYPELKNEYFR
jgi:hypothetical protein